MKVLFSKNFIKQYKKLPQDMQKKIRKRTDLFRRDSRNRLLNIHNLKGEKKHILSMNVTGNYRVLFEWVEKNTAMFYEIGTHSQLY